MKLLIAITILTSIFITPKFGLAAQDLYLDLAKKSFPNIAWVKNSILFGDVNCDAKSDASLLGIFKNQIVVAAFLAESKKSNYLISLPISRFNLKTLTLKLEPLDLTDKEFEDMIGSRPEGLMQSNHCMGLNLSDSQVDTLHIYWNTINGELSAWSL